jgi:hypothetical protein
MVVGNSGLHERKNFSEKYSRYRQSTSKKFCSPVLGRKVKNIGFTGRQIINLPRSPTNGGPTLPTGVILCSRQDNCLCECVGARARVFGALEELRKATASFVMYVYLPGSPFVRHSFLMGQQVSHHTDFQET